MSSKLATDPKKITADALREAALRYLDQRDASVDQVRRLLHRRIFKYANPEETASAFEHVEQILGRLVDSKVLDDERFARGLAEGQRRRGGSLAKVRQKLMSRGLSGQHIEEALGSLSGDDELGEEAAALTYARKRRLSEKYDLKDPKQRAKALAALARQGFSFEIARNVLGL